MKLKNYKKQPILNFAPYSFLIFLDMQLHEPKISEKTISEYFGNGVLVFQEKFHLFRGVRSPQKVEDEDHKFRLNGSEGFNKIFDVGTFENL